MMGNFALIKRFVLQRGVRYGLLVCVALYVVVTVKNIWNDVPDSRGPTDIKHESKNRHGNASNLHENKVTGNENNEIVNLARKVSLYNTCKTVLVSVVNNSFLPFAYNWLCNTKDKGVLKSVLVITTDIESKMNLTRDWPDITVFHLTPDISKGNQDYRHVGYIKIMIRRTEIILSLLQADIDMLLLEFDYIWFSNPVPVLQRFSGVDLLVNPVSTKTGVYSGGFLYLFATERTKTLWTKVTEMMIKLGQDIKNKPDTKAVSQRENDQVYLSKLIREKFSGIRIALLPLDVYADGKWYSMTAAKREKSHPIVISNNWIVGTKKKMERAKQFGHWFLKDDRTCDMDAMKKIVKIAN